jgi:uncharacterized protein
MTDEPELIFSPLQRSITRGGKTVEINIYRIPTSGWTLEVVDEYRNSTVWDHEFETDQQALDQVLSEIESEGIEGFIGTPSGIHRH